MLRLGAREAILAVSQPLDVALWERSEIRLSGQGRLGQRHERAEAVHLIAR